MARPANTYGETSAELSEGGVLSGDMEKGHIGDLAQAKEDIIRLAQSLPADRSAQLLGKGPRKGNGENLVDVYRG